MSTSPTTKSKEHTCRNTHCLPTYKENIIYLIEHGSFSNRDSRNHWGTQIDHQQREHAQSRPQRLSSQASPPSAAGRAPGRILPGSFLPGFLVYLFLFTPQIYFYLSQGLDIYMGFLFGACPSFT